MKIKFDLDEELSVNKAIEIPSTTIVMYKVMMDKQKRI